jgi:hypothetical protein
MAASDYWHILSVLGTFIVTFIGTTYLYKSGGPKVSTPKVGGFGDMAKDLVSYIPHSLLLFGIIADIFTYQGVYSLTTLIGIISIVANWIFGYLWSGLHIAFVDAYTTITEGPANPRGEVPGRNIVKGSSPTTGGGQPGEYFKTYDGCSIQGFTALQSKYTIQTLVITATIMSYYMFDNLKNRGGTMSAATIVAFIVFYGAQWWAVGSCDKPATTTTEGVTGAVESATQSVANVFGNSGKAPSEVSETMKKIISLIQGMFFGGMSYIAVEGTKPSLLPSAAISPFPRKTTKDLIQGPDGTYKDENGKRYICLPNGQCYPDLGDEATREDIAALIGESLGSGTPAIPDGCPNKK